MKNSTVRRMVCDQFNCDHRDVEVEFVSMINNKYEFIVTGETIIGTKFKKSIFISIVDI